MFLLVFQMIVFIRGFSLLDRWGGFCLRAAGCVQ